MTKDDNQTPIENYAKSMLAMGQASQDLAKIWLESFQSLGIEVLSSKPQSNKPDPELANSSPSPLDSLLKAKTNSDKALAAQMELWAGYQQLWMNTTQALIKNEAPKPTDGIKSDRRFKDPEWTENPVFNFLKESYLLNARWVKSMTASIEDVDADTAMKIDFYARQLIDAWAPTNFALTNPEVLREIKNSNGENLTKGLQNLADDIAKSAGTPTIRQTDMNVFEVGKNIAVTEGSVIFQNEIFQLIQYAAKTDTVFKVPLLIIPPWINKYYILDLQPENSFVSWLTEQGYTVFLISWVNPDESLRHKGLSDYMKEGILTALDVIEKATGEKEINTIGYCIGGTLLAITLGYLAAKKIDRIKSATFLAAQIDFTEAGELRVFTDKEQIDLISAQVEAQGYLDGAAMAWIFNMLRPNDLIWSFVINNYLMGKDPQPFDLLYWNADSTRFPAKMIVEYLRNMYQNNLLAKSGGISVDGTPIDLTLVKTPAFFQATREDHIAPYPSVFKAMNIFSGPKTFALAGSGHIAGIVNHPSKEKYQFWHNNKRKKYKDADAWLAEASETSGSWWPSWHIWNSKKSGPKIKARHPGNTDLPILEPAPGSYVKVKS
ncbi:MAG: class I poly(R)-hydroxyalkanoic acid synthase [Rhodospirillaceae bacterium]